MIESGTYNTRESDVDLDRIEELCEGKTAEELDQEFEDFKSRFIKEHSQ